MTVKEYHRMSKSYQNGLKREYKLRYTDEYSYAFKLKWLIAAGLVFAFVSLLCAWKFDLIAGLTLCGLFLIYCIYILVLIHKSNKHFEKFLNNLSRKF